MTSVILQPAGASGEHGHYAMTVAEGVTLDGALLAALTAAQRSRLEALNPGSPLKVRLWGVRPPHRSKWERLGSGDLVLFARSNHYFSAGTVTYTFHNPALARLLWGEHLNREGTPSTWEYMYALGDLRPMSIPYAEVNRIVGYAENNVPQGFTVVSEPASLVLMNTYAPGATVVGTVLPPHPFDPNDPTSRQVLAQQRLEQGYLRQVLGLAQGGEQICDLCGIQYPVSLLVAGHIKKRAACSEDERKDLANIAMRCCVLGCDALFERRLIYVDPSGHVAISNKAWSCASLRHYLERFKDRACGAFRAETAGYFRWHRENRLP